MNKNKYNLKIDTQPPIEYANIIVENFNALMERPIEEFKSNDIDTIINAYHYATSIKSKAKFAKDIDKTDVIKEISTKSYFEFLTKSKTMQHSKTPSHFYLTYRQTQEYRQLSALYKVHNNLFHHLKSGVHFAIFQKLNRFFSPCLLNKSHQYWTR